MWSFHEKGELYRMHGTRIDHEKQVFSWEKLKVKRGKDKYNHWIFKVKQLSDSNEDS